MFSKNDSYIGIIIIYKMICEMIRHYIKSFESFGQHLLGIFPAHHPARLYIQHWSSLGELTS